MKEASLGQKTRNRGLKSFFSEWFGNSRHHWMWDSKSMERELKSAGFERVRRAQAGDWHDTMFGYVENRKRWGNALGAECVM